MLSKLEHILATFDKNAGSVTELTKFDQLVLDFAINHLTSLQQRLTKVHGLDNPRYDVAHTLQALTNIRTNESLRPHYAEMLNQCAVLLVSYFSAAAGDIFRTCIAEAVRRGDRASVLKEEIKIALRDVRDIGSELAERSGELLADHRDISFQDMQSIGRAFRDYFAYDPPRDEDINDIITSQACRHVIVHSGGVADRKMVNQLRNANPRRLKVNIKEYDRIQFTAEEIGFVIKRMTTYLRDLALSVDPEAVT